MHHTVSVIHSVFLNLHRLYENNYIKATYIIVLKHKTYFHSQHEIKWKKNGLHPHNRILASTQPNIRNQTRLLIQLLLCKYYANCSLSHSLSFSSTSRHEASPPCPICEEMSDIQTSCCASFSKAYRSLISSDRALAVLAMCSWGIKSNQSVDVWWKTSRLAFVRYHFY